MITETGHILTVFDLILPKRITEFVGILFHHGNTFISQVCRPISINQSLTTVNTYTCTSTSDWLLIILLIYYVVYWNFPLGYICLNIGIPRFDILSVSQHSGKLFPNLNEGGCTEAVGSSTLITCLLLLLLRTNNTEVLTALGWIGLITKKHFTLDIHHNTLWLLSISVWWWWDMGSVTAGGHNRCFA